MRVSSFAAAVCMAAAAHADHTSFMRADLQVYDGTSWADAATIVPGQSVECRIVISFDLASGLAVSWKHASFTQFDVSSTRLGDVASTLTGYLVPPTQTISLFNAGAAGAKIDRLDNPVGSIQLDQVATVLGGSADNPIDVAHFWYIPTAANFEVRDLTVSVPTNGFFAGSVYTSTTGSSTTILSTAHTFDGAVIHVVPAPGVGGLCVAMVARASRRRR